jgi:hypothetical protein
MHHSTYFKSRRGVIFLSAAFLLASSFLVSCKKKQSELGKNMIAVEDLLASGAVDTFTLETWSVEEDSIPTSNRIYGLVGALNDPKMGTFSSELYTQLRATGSLSLQPSDVITVDSVVFALEFGGFYGNNGPATFEVYRLEDSLTISSVYYKNTVKNVQPANLIVPAYATFTPKPTTSVIVSGDTVPAQLRLRLDPALGLTLLTDASSSATSAIFNDNTAFTSTYFKGLNVRVSNTSPAVNQGAVYFFKMQASNTKLTVYYRLNGSTSQFRYDLLSNGLCADYNKVTVDNTGHDVQTVIDNPENNPMQRFYAQAHNSYGVVDMRTLLNIPQKSIVHASMLELPVEYFPNSPFYPSPAISVGYMVDGNIVPFATALYDDDSRSYLVDLRDFTQAAVLGETDYTQLYFSPIYAGGAPERIIFNGPNTINRAKPRLIVKLTEY